MNPNEFVIATQPVNGIVINSVGIINSVDVDKAQVYFIGKNEVVIAPFESLSHVDVENTGKGHPQKICNMCHILKPMSDFARNQNDAKGRPTRRPSCNECRKTIEGKNMSASEKRRMMDKRPNDKAIFVCPICEKRSIVGVNANIVADHDHDTGKGREWICDSCNTGLGRFKDDIDILERVIDYLKRFEDEAPE